MEKVTNILPSNNVSDSSELVKHTNCIGRILGFTENEQAIVDYPGNPNEPVVARSILNANPLISLSCNELYNENVLLTFEHGDPTLPIIIGLIHDELYIAECEDVNLTASKSRVLHSDGEKLVIEAEKEVVLRCGQGSITLHSNGKVIVKGTQLISRSSGANKIKGATVNIN